MGLYKLIRQPAGPSAKHPNDSPRAIRGQLFAYDINCITEAEENVQLLASTLENTEYVIPSGLYKIAVTVSPKFGTLMPLLLQVHGRSGIRIHYGTKPGHSLGCILITNRTAYQALVLRLIEEQETGEPIYLNIQNHEKRKETS